MLSSIQHIISEHHLVLQPKNPFVVKVKDSFEGILLANDILKAISDKKTALFLSGGKTPKDFYTLLGKESVLTVGAVGLVDERYGEKMHENSNELMIEKTGLLDYLEKKQTPFYPILCHSERSEESNEILRVAQDDNLTLEQTASQYDETLRFIFNGFQKSIGILGIGLDGHTAGIPINTSLNNKDQSLVTCFTNFPGPQKERISMTFLGLSMLDVLLVLVFGEDKKEALENMFRDGSESEIPARFFKRPEIAQKTLVITDQNI